MYILECLPIQKQISKLSYSYLSHDDVNLGSLVQIPFAKRTLEALVINKTNAKDFKQELRNKNFILKKIDSVTKESALDPDFIESLNEVSSLFLINNGEIYNKAISKKILHQEKIEHSSLKNKEKDEIFVGPKKLSNNFIKEKIKESLKEKKSIHVICPTQQRARILYKELSDDFKNLFLLDSKVNEKKHVEVFEKISLSESILITTPSYLALNQKNKALIIIDSEHSEHYQHKRDINFDFRKIISIFAKKKNIKCIYTTHILRPSLNVAEFKLHNFFKKNNLENISFINLNEKQKEKISDTKRIQEITKKNNFEYISEKILNEIKKDVAENKKIFCFVSRKSLAPYMICSSCGELAKDENGNPYSLFIKNNKAYFKSRKDAQEIHAFDTCIHCSGLLRTFGLGTEKYKNILSEKIKDLNIGIIDGEHLNTEAKIKKSIKAGANIHIGTVQALAHLDLFDKTYVLNLDSLFSIFSYELDYKILNILISLNEINMNEKTLVQTRINIKNKINYFSSKNYLGLRDENLKILKQINETPFVKKIHIEHAELKNTNEIENLQNYYQKYFSKNVESFSKHKSNNRYTLKLILAFKSEHWENTKKRKELSAALPRQSKNIKIELF